MDNGKSTVARTPAKDCLACFAKMRHDPKYVREFHPLAGHGYTKETGWTHPDLAGERK